MWKVKGKYDESLVSCGRHRTRHTPGRVDNHALRVSRAVSLILHPFAVPIYATIALLLYDPTMTALPLRIKLLFVVVIIIIALLIPALSLFLLRTMNLKPAILKSYDRSVALVIVTLSYGICIAMITELRWETIFYKFILIALFCSAAVLVVTFIWRISLYMIPLGAVTAIFLLYTFAGVQAIMLPLAVTILLSGILASSRLYLGKHNLLQVAAGFTLGFAVCVAVMFFIR